jgi:tryptophan synthase alpha chain
MDNPIDRTFRKKSGIKLMTHIVGGYPNLEKSFETALAMAESGADLLEIQIPFSDSLADGPTIMEANRIALENGSTPEKCFDLAERLNKRIDIPILFMTYANIPFQMGIEKFIRRSCAVGVSGLIIPDFTFDERVDGYFELAERAGIYPIHVVSPDTKDGRLRDILKIARGFVYITLRVGITGEIRRIEADGIRFLDNVRKKTSVPTAAGFGLSSVSHIRELEGRADAAVVGSHLINLFQMSGIAGIRGFLGECRRIS